MECFVTRTGRIFLLGCVLTGFILLRCPREAAGIDTFGGDGNFIGGHVTLTSSDCALLLHRHYVHGVGRTPALQFKDFFEAFKTSFVSAGPHEQVCIKYSDINSAVREAKSRLNYVHPYAANDPLPEPKDIAPTAELTLLVTKILATQFRMTHDEIMNGLPLIDTSKTELYDLCPAHVKPVPCTVERYRSMDGRCNNIKHPSWGVTNTPFVRFLPPLYSDGVQGPRLAADGGELPKARAISSFIHRDFDHPNRQLSILVMSWGQFIDHDLTLAAPPRDERDLDFECCSVPKKYQHPLCMTIEVPRDDPFYGQYGRDCIEFKRSLAGQRPGCALGPRSHINILTHAIDANFIYGSSDALAKKLRSFHRGHLRVWDRFRNLGLKPMLPPESENPERDCIARPRHLFCFLAGDERVNEQIHLTVLHTFYVRDHNRMADELARLNPHWDDDRIYHETRHIMAAAVQFITFNEFLPMVVGEENMVRYNLTLQKEGYWHGYDPDVNLALSNSFQSAAFRFGHTFIQGMVRRYNKYHEFIGEDLLRNLLRQPFIVYEPGKLDELAGGLINTPAQTYDPFVTQEVTNHLFQNPEEPFGKDLIAINLQRAREHGVPGYNSFREWCGLPRAHTFADFEPWLNNGTAFRYSQIYKHPDDVDLWSGGISERVMPGAMIGPTFACIIARQFSNLRRGDRFWFENPGLPSSFTPEQLHEIRKATQSKIICENGDDIPTIQLWVMRLPHPIYNPRFRCEDIPGVDLRYWQEDPVHGGYSFKK
ncbi:salivary peroxidase/catechol oxidase-like [Rhipicephalus microplus]|uniref:salivary peroxidase/catechol oxidase-like n=1 Tax=Rhipicephalus microplus TaxID=6941 RepID=UPI00237686AA